MPTIYLSPSIQPYNKYLTEGDEQYWMNRIADDMVPMLEQNGINVVRNTPNTSLGQAIRESNAGNYDLHLALHSNAGRQIWRGSCAGRMCTIIRTALPASARRSLLPMNCGKFTPTPTL